MRRRPTRGGNKRPHLRACIKRCIANIQPSCDGLAHNSPIKIDGEGGLDCTTLRDCMESKFNVVSVDRDAAVTHLREIGQTNRITDELSTGHGKCKLQVCQSNSVFTGIRSSIGHACKSARVEHPEMMKKELGIFVNGMVWMVAAAKRCLGLKLTEGKEAMTFEACELCAKALFQSSEKGMSSTTCFWCSIGTS